MIEDGGTVLSDSNGILVYLARKYAPDWLPADAVGEGEVQKFLSQAAGDIAHGPAAARLITVFGASLDPEHAASVAKRAFDRLEHHLIPALTDHNRWAHSRHPIGMMRPV